MTMTVSTDRPLVVACLRITDLRTEVDPLSGVVRRDPKGAALSAADSAALEHAVRIASLWSGHVLAICVGPSSVDPVLREVAALGVETLRVTTDQTSVDSAYGVELAGDEQALARAIATAIADVGTPTLVVCGDRSADRGTGAVPALLAHEFHAAQALGLVSLDVEPGQSDKLALVAERRLDRGWRERLRVPMPAVCSVEGAGVRLRRATLSGLLTAEAGQIPTVSWEPATQASLGPAWRVGPTRPYTPRARVLPGPDDSDPRIRLLTLTGALVAHDPPTVIGPVDASEAADQLLDYLGRHGYLEGRSSPDTSSESC
jgi:electron transfer flavoprotein beta subunit